MVLDDIRQAAIDVAQGCEPKVSQASLAFLTAVDILRPEPVLIPQSCLPPLPLENDLLYMALIFDISRSVCVHKLRLFFFLLLPLMFLSGVLCVIFCLDL